MLKNFFNKHENYSSELISYLRLIRTEFVGIKTFYNLLKYYGSPSAAVEHLPEFMRRAGKPNFKVASSQIVMQEIEAMNKIGARYLIYSDHQYPKILKHIPDPPPVLSYKGSLDILKNESVAIVGARNASISGMNLAGKIAKDLAKSDINVVSGLARGIDTAAHKAAIPNTIAVIAGGIDNYYPEENRKIQDQISEEGLLLAELPIKTVPHSRHFPQRNRIISGLSKATIVVEAALNSGSLITAKLAVEQNREIFSCPGYPLDPRSSGTNKLIKEGANLFSSTNEVIEFIKQTTKLHLEEDVKEFDQKPVRYKLDESYLNDSNREKILSLLSPVPISVEELADNADIPMPVVLTILLELELQGKIVYHPRNRISLNY